ncbi:glycosyltransferase, partial [Infirmifilum sp.]|uniref:glycosyltransferase n=1 Tax=Infirmifilum sp. TaxID=2856575 RepID=UPI003D0FA735
SPSEAYHIPMMRSRLEDWLIREVKGSDIIHIHNAHSVFSVNVGLTVKRLKPDIKLVFTLHYHGSGHSIIRSALWFLWRRYVAKLIDMSNVIHTVSRTEASRVLEHYPKADGKLIIIPNGVEEDVQGYKWTGEGSDYIIYAGRIERYKNLEKAIETAKQLELKLLVIGEGSYRSKLETKARKMYPDRVTFMRFLPRTQYLELLAKAKYAINPSKKEAFSIFIAEAIAIGIPAIVSKEIAANLNVDDGRMLEGELVMVEKARINTWGDILGEYIKKLYGSEGEL